MEHEEHIDLIRSLKNEPTINSWPHPQQMAFFHGIASVLTILGMVELAQEFGGMRDKGMTTGGVDNEIPYETNDFISGGGSGAEDSESHVPFAANMAPFGF